MNAISKSTMALALLSGAAYAQVPSTNDTSDGLSNTGMGTGALNPAMTGTDNTASGAYALHSNTTGADNTASGFQALYSNSTGYDNTASGVCALVSNTTGNSNTASGTSALYINTTGNDNTAAGVNALYTNTTGNDNTAAGVNALYTNTAGNGNTASGYQALYNNTTGSNNIALGYEAGYNVKTGSNNIEIGNKGTGADFRMIKIGTEGTQTKTFIAGIYNTSVSGSAVMVDSVGQLGVVVSSERFKTAIAPMGVNTEKLSQLRPVTFKLKTDAQGTVQYGLVAEEVAKVYPELVIRDENGRIDGVRYDELAPMLLNEVQKQAAELRDLKQQEQQKTAAQDVEISKLKQQLADIRAALITRPNKDQLVAQR
jgi:Chaperone of endosialidase